MDFLHKWLVIQKTLPYHKAIVTYKYFSRWNQHAFSYKNMSIINIFVTTIVLGISIAHRPVLCKRHSDDSWLTATPVTGNDRIIDNLMNPIDANRSTVSWFLPFILIALTTVNSVIRLRPAIAHSMPICQLCWVASYGRHEQLQYGRPVMETVNFHELIIFFMLVDTKVFDWLLMVCCYRWICRYNNHCQILLIVSNWLIYESVNSLRPNDAYMRR